MAEKVVWITVTLRFSCSDVDSDTSLISIKTADGETMKQLSAKVCRLLNLSTSGYVFQLRNARGSLIPLNGKLEENTKENPYLLSVFKEYQTVMPKPRSVQADTFSSTIHNQTQMFLSRISNLENTIPELKVKREEKIKQEIQELEDKLNFLQKRFNEADQMEWTGIIKKSPLW
ncbi:uncharacterized protein LOC143298013 [Babylonia areolata]|uniref:uncharacterized protein LOC143298013 n=1 Tax=Babylonia areolata TaxID=304850 RepID=UPI003FCF7D9A